MHKHFKDSSAFTVAEILVAISVLGILLSLAFYGFSAYLKNAQNTQIASTVSAYQDAVVAMQQEHQLVPDNYPTDTGLSTQAELFSCLSTTSSTSSCCFLYQIQSGTGTGYVGCNTNANFGDFGLAPGQHFQGGFYYNSLGYTASDLSSWTRQYLPTTLPQIPQFSPTLPNCATGSAYQDQTVNCNGQTAIGLLVSITPGGEAKAYLHYKLPVDRDCQSKDTVTLSESAPAGGGYSYGPLNATYTGAKYTKRVSYFDNKYTFCVVGIR